MLTRKVCRQVTNTSMGLSIMKVTILRMCYNIHTAVCDKNVSTICRRCMSASFEADISTGGLL